MNPPPRRRLTLPWKTRVALFFISSASDAVRRRDGTVNRRILGLADSNLGLRTLPSSKPDYNGVRVSDVMVDPSRNLWFRLFVPSKSIGSDLLPVVVFFHGGGFVFMSAESKAYDAVCRRFAREIPAVVLSVNYRLAPEHRYPAQYEDAFDVMRFLEENRDGTVLPSCADVSRCFVAGDSAGGNIAHHVTVRLCKESSNFANLQIIGVFNIQPFFGGEERTKAELELAGIDPLVSMERTDWMWNAFMPNADRDHPVCNVSGPRAEDISKLDNFPPITVVIAGFDSLKDWQMKYYEWLKNSGKEVYLVEFPNTFHAFYIFPEIPESGQLMAEAKKFVEDRCSKVVGKG